ncbi:MAG: 4-hydroxy-tetrahydrodipicolinate synthase [Candidatus Cloacimonetes bacterium]|nr:4-hydroxy-tetrahydrodipicolinate synthase [Candidatus Cloacimonadota bacterium]
MIRGSYVALVTPFRDGEIDYNAVEGLIAMHIEQGTHGILLCGTTAETPALAGDEKERLVRFGIQKINGRVPVMVGTGSNNLPRTIAATQQASSWGAGSALVVTPYYNKPTPEGLYQFYRKVHDNTSIPIVMYNVPGRTGCKMSAETALRLAYDCPRIVALKEASGDLVLAMHVIRDAPEGFSVMSGEDALNLPLLAAGARGVISVTANIIPAQIAALCNAAACGEWDKARSLHLAQLDMHAALFVESNPIPVKQALALAGRILADVRPPLAPLSAHRLPGLTNVLRRYKLID